MRKNKPSKQKNKSTKKKSGQSSNKIAAFSPNSKVVVGFLVVGFVLILCNFIFFISRHAVDIPYWDQWDLSDLILGKFDISKVLTAQHNEHRIGVGLIIMKILAYFSNWSQVVEIIFIALLIFSSAVMIIYAKYLINHKLEFSDIIIPLIMLNIFQADNLTWGFQIAFVLPLFFFCIWILSLRIQHAIIRYAALTFLSLLSAFSSAHGLILPLVTIIFVLAEYVKYKVINVKVFTGIMMANALIVMLYFIGYVANLQTASPFSFSRNLIDFFSFAINSGFFQYDQSFVFHVSVTVIVLFFFMYGTLHFFKKSAENYHMIIGFFLILYALIFSSLISIGRSALGADHTLWSRYISFTMLIPIGLYFVFLNFKNKSYLTTCLIVFILFNMFFFTRPLERYFLSKTTGKQNAMRCYKVSDMTNYHNCYEVYSLYPDKDFINSKIVSTLRYKKINMFDMSSLQEKSFR
jgi:hypothetical protein